eukprot:GGOE01000732.1.p1 GENE.GGOE01000732.1~~GGOE01000732.1.p1  ORF type:complete len:551 (-),score=93.79 GGOE01000732.1:220-1872(-)
MRVELVPLGVGTETSSAYYGEPSTSCAVLVGGVPAMLIGHGLGVTHSCLKHCGFLPDVVYISNNGNDNAGELPTCVVAEAAKGRRLKVVAEPGVMKRLQEHRLHECKEGLGDRPLADIAHFIEAPAEQLTRLTDQLALITHPAQHTERCFGFILFFGKEPILGWSSASGCNQSYYSRIGISPTLVIHAQAGSDYSHASFEEVEDFEHLLNKNKTVDSQVKVYVTAYGRASVASSQVELLQAGKAIVLLGAGVGRIETSAGPCSPIGCATPTLAEAVATSPPSEPWLSPPNESLGESLPPAALFTPIPFSPSDAHPSSPACHQCGSPVQSSHGASPLAQGRASSSPPPPMEHTAQSPPLLRAQVNSIPAGPGGPPNLRPAVAMHFAGPRTFSARPRTQSPRTPLAQPPVAPSDTPHYALPTVGSCMRASSPQRSQPQLPKSSPPRPPSPPLVVVPVTPPRKVFVFDNENKARDPKVFVLNSYIRTLEQLKFKASEALNMKPVRHLLTTSGTAITNLEELVHGQELVAVRQAGGSFDPTDLPAKMGKQRPGR